VALANYYSQEANAAHDRAGEHRKMAKSYQGVTTTGRGPGANMPAHCKSLVNLYEGIAAEYEGMSVDHQKLAESAPT
jgi:hypothetical protein